MRLRTLTFIFCIALSAAAHARRDNISPVLLEEWSKSPNEVTDVIVHLAAQADVSGMDDALRKMKATRAHRHQVVVHALREAASATQGGLIEDLNRLKNEGVVQGFKTYWISNCAVVFGLPSAIETIANRHDVQWIEPNFKPVLIEPVTRRHNSNSLDLNHGIPTGIRAIRAPEVWYDLGYTGAGSLIGGLDTGVDGNHPALAARWRGLHADPAECWLNVLGGGTTFPVDNNSHGTHTMGTMCGNSTVSNDSIGVAPEAEWISCNAIDQGASGGFTNDIIDGFEWFADPDGNEFTVDDVPDVVQNSWGIDARFPGFTDCFNDWNDVILNCEAAGVVVTWSAGNEGPAAQTNRSPATVAIDSVTMFSVGAVDANSDTIPPYVIAGFSSRGPSDCPPMTAIKPEVCAPGVHVYSSLPNSNYDFYDGTSMAGPHVAGIVALMRQANPDAEVREIKSILMQTAIDMGPEGEDNSYGVGFVDAYEAVLQISADRAVIRGFVTDASNSLPIEGALVAAEGDAERTTDETGWYRMSVHADTTWTITCNAFGYAPQEYEVAVIAGDTLDLNFELLALPNGTLIGTVVAGDNLPVYNARVTFSGTPVTPMFTDENGTFSVSLPGGVDYTYLVEYHDAADSGGVFITADEEVNLGIALISPRSEIQGPDDYGYKAYDNLDFGIAPELDWVEISPTIGGAGEILSLPAHDSSAWIEMPFPFVYYGESYDSLTINENGWLAAGVSHDHTFSNTMIGSVAGPSAMMAIYWDNLHDNDSTSEICYWFDGENGRIIIEYYRMNFLPSITSEATFQIHIYSADARPTPTGDCEILTLYSRIDVPFSSTVGIENPLETDGVQVLYNGAYGDNSWLVSERTGILFTTRDSVLESGVPNRNVLVESPSLSSAYPNPFNNSTQLDFALPHSAHVRIHIYDVLARLTTTLADADFAAGNHTLSWDASGLAAGLYFVRMDAAGYNSTRKVLLLK